MIGVLINLWRLRSSDDHGKPPVNGRCVPGRPTAYLARLIPISLGRPLKHTVLSVVTTTFGDDAVNAVRAAAGFFLLDHQRRHVPMQRSVLCFLGAGYSSIAGVPLAKNLFRPNYLLAMSERSHRRFTKILKHPIAIRQTVSECPLGHQGH
jgi:hypothetical protein